jgi:subtilase family serine protease
MSSKLSLWFTVEKNRLDFRVCLGLEELETRALLSVGSTAAATSLLSDVTAQTNTTTITPAVNPTFSGYTPQQLQAAYGVPATVNGQLAGAGETIAIVDAYNDPNIAKDLATFDAKYGLPTANLTVVNQNGSSSNLPANNTGWAVEESLDVEWAHAIAPGAKIVLVEANSSSLSDLLTAVNTATSKEGANVVSMSWGASEFSSETSYDKYFTAPGVTYVASAGDSSAYFGPEWPASSPNVLAVGGTTLNLTSSNTISSETAWSASYSRYYGWEGGGGGISSYETAPAYQSNIPAAQQYNARTTPDVGWDANPSTGVSVYDSYGEPGWGYVGGTSAGAPAWAGIVAIADQQSVADGNGSLSTNQVESTLYQAYSGKVGSGYSNYFHDIASGNNGYSAATGYDLATGLGSPKVSALISLLANPSSASSSTLSGTKATTTTSKQQTASNPAAPHTVLDGNGSVSDPSASSVAGLALNPPALVPPSVLAGSSTALVNNLSFLPLSIAAPSLSLSSNTSLVESSLNTSPLENATVFGASGWGGAPLSWQLSSLGLPGQQVEQLASDLPGNGNDDLTNPSAEDVLRDAGDATGEDLSVLDLTAPPLLDGEAGNDGEGSDGASGE